MDEGGRTPSKKQHSVETSQVTEIVKPEKFNQLVAEMLAGQIIDIKPQLYFNNELGFIYPPTEEILQVKSRKAVLNLEFLVEKGILKKNFFDRILCCARC